MNKKFKKLLAFEVKILFIIFVIIYISNKDYKINVFNLIFEKFNNKVFNKEEFVNDFDKNSSFIEPSTFNSNNDLYKEIERGFLEANSIINLKGYPGCDSADEVFATVEEVVKNNPEILYYKGGKYLNGLLKPSYFKTKEEIVAQQSFIRKMKVEIINKIIKPEMTDYEKEKVIHDFIVNNTKYDNRFFNEEESVSPESHTVYGVLVKGVAVCEGYAKTMKYLLDEVGIESVILDGTANDENHAWNLIKIDDNYYHVDSTWDDPVMSDGSNQIRYDYFNITDEEIGITHKWDREEYPISDKVKYSYYYYNGLIVKNYDEFYSKLKNAIIKKASSFEIKILDYQEDKYNISKSVEKVVKSKSMNIKSINYTYSINPDLGIIKITFYYQ